MRHTLKKHKGGGCACSGSGLGFPQTGGYALGLLGEKPAQPQMKPSWSGNGDSDQGNSPGEEPHNGDGVSVSENGGPELHDTLQEKPHSRLTKKKHKSSDIIFLESRPELIKGMCTLFADNSEVYDTDLFVHPYEVKGLCSTPLKAKHVRMNNGRHLEAHVKGLGAMLTGVRPKMIEPEGEMSAVEGSPSSGELEGMASSSSGGAGIAGIAHAAHHIAPTHHAAEHRSEMRKSRADGIAYLQSNPEVLQGLCPLFKNHPNVYIKGVLTKPELVKGICNGAVLAKNVKMSNGHSVAHHVNRLRRLAGMSGGDMFGDLFGSSEEGPSGQNVIMSNGRPVTTHLAEISGENSGNSGNSGTNLFGGRRKSKSKKSKKSRKSRKTRRTRKPRTK